MITAACGRRLRAAARHLLADPLARYPALRGPLAASAAELYGVLHLDLENFAWVFGGDPAWLESPSWPAGCSVGGGVAAYFALREGQDRPTPRQVREHNRHLIHTVARITSEGSAAGYDSHGIVVSTLNLDSGEVRLLRARTPGDIDERGHLTIQELYRLEPGLEAGTHLALVTGAQTRAATQGDNMYSRANAHLHYEWATRDPLEGALPADQLARLREALPTVLNEMGPFSVGHNGDVNSKLKWERFFFSRGFYTDADADSKELPRLVRICWEALRADEHRAEGPACLRWLINELIQAKVLPARFEDEGRTRTREEMEDDLLATLGKLAEAGASQVARACAAAARLVTWCDPTSVYVFECLTHLPARPGSPYPPTVLVRGPKAGGMVLYEDAEDSTIPIKFASSLSNLRGQIARFDDQVESEIPVDYIATGAKVCIREGTVQYQTLDDWQLAEVVPDAAGERPTIRIYDLLTGEALERPMQTSPIIDYVLRGQRETGVLKAEGEFANLPVTGRTVTYDSVLGEILEGPASIEGRQIQNFPTEERPRAFVDNQYAAEILLSTVALRRNTEALFDYAHGAGGQIEGAVLPRPRALFRQDDGLDRSRLRKILRRIRYVCGLGEGTSRNVAGIASSCSNLEGLSDVILDSRESNLARTEAPRLDDATLAYFISNSGGTKPVVALAEELLDAQDGDLTQGPWVWAVTNISTSELARLADRNLGAAITNLPWEKAVGSTYAAFTALQSILTMLVYMHQVRGAIRPGRARFLYQQIASFPEVCERTLSDKAAKDEIDRLAHHIAGNAVDIAFVGALQGHDAAEAALKFAEMMQHTRVKFYSGAYEQHGQRATYLRALHANPGTLVILLVPNLDTSIGSWMAQLIQENRPRAGKIAVLCAGEDAQALKEAGADYVVRTPRGCADSMFTDALGKMILANMLTEATIRASNHIAGKIRGWGRRLLDASPEQSAEAIPRLQDELEVIRAQFDHLREGDFGGAERRRVLVDTERQLGNEIIDLDGREGKLRHLYLGSRRLTLINPAQLDRVDDLIRTLLDLEPTKDKDVQVFYNLLDDLILEFSDRSLAMRLADERHADDAARAKLAVHYQGMAKIIGANPIKPDNIAKFQQGWGIPSFLLPPGRRRSDPTTTLADSLHLGDDAPARLDRARLVEVGFTAAAAEIAEGFTSVVEVEKAVLLSPRFSGGGRVRSFEARDRLLGPSEEPHDYKLDEGMLEQVFASGRSQLHATPAGDMFQLQLVVADRYGDVSEALLLAGAPRASLTCRADALEAVPLLARKAESLAGWLGVVDPEADPGLLEHVPLLDLLTLDEKTLVERLRELVERHRLAAALPFPEPFSFLGVDPTRLAVADLRTLTNVFTAVTAVASASIYRVEVRWEGGNRRYWAWRDVDRLYKTAAGTVSSYDTGKEMRGNKLIAVRGGRLKMGFGRDGARTVIVPIQGDTGDVSHIVLMHIEVDEGLDVEARKRTLGEKYEHIVDHASEYIEWDDQYLAQVPMVDLLMLSDEEIADDRIVPLAKKASTLERVSASS